MPPAMGSCPDSLRRRNITGIAFAVCRLENCIMIMQNDIKRVCSIRQIILLFDCNFVIGDGDFGIFADVDNGAAVVAVRLCYFEFNIEFRRLFSHLK